MRNRNSAGVSVDEAKPHDLLLVTEELPIHRIWPTALLLLLRGRW